MRKYAMKAEQNTKNINVLKTHCPGLEVSTEAAVLESHGCDWTRFRKPDPTAVVFPRCIEDVASVVGLAAEHRISLVPSCGRG